MRGQVSAPGRHHGRREDHPRGCGDKQSAKPQIRHVAGSPPRMRGQDLIGPAAASILRITPADAGTRIVTQLVGYNLWDHPRGCGDKAMHTHGKPMATGSPPRMRGQEIRGLQRCHSMGITPADAGTRPHAVCELSECWDHPRGCGDKFQGQPHAGRRPGSPPRMRGQAAIPIEHNGKQRITPADAGTSRQALDTL